VATDLRAEVADTVDLRRVVAGLPDTVDLRRVVAGLPDTVDLRRVVAAMARLLRADSAVDLPDTDRRPADSDLLHRPRQADSADLRSAR
jgi:hypothetical protein